MAGFNGLSGLRMITVAGVGLLVAAAVWRGVALADFYRSARAADAPELARAIQQSLRVAQSHGGPASGRRLVEQLCQRLPEDALARLEVHRFDADAAVFVTAGPDRQPGQAGFDDDQDGTVDNPSELGAVFSDDATLAPTSTGYAAATESPHARVISRGAYVPLAADRPLPAAARLRVVVHAEAGGRRLVWPVEPRFGEEG